jgi:glycosyltransferase involved in cell wall biosynthesis
MFVARSIDNMAGGVERMVITVMNNLVARGHSVDLFTWDLEGAIAFYHMSPKIKWYKLDMGSPLVKASISLILSRASAVRNIVRRCQPDIIICFQDGPFMAMRVYTAGMGIPFITSERNAPTRFNYTSAGRRQKLIYNAFRFAKRILIQFASYKELYPSFLHNRIVPISNPVFPANGRARPEVTNAKGRFRILSVGRLSYQKNYPVLIDAFASLSSFYPEWDLVIIGEGEDQEKLEDSILDKGLKNLISMPGKTTSIADYYISSHLFCLPSLWEGFPNALAEALAYGLPAVGFSDCAGVRDLIVSGKNGLLAEGNGDSETLAKALEMLMVSTETRRVMSEAAIESVKTYSPEKIFSQWEQLLSSAAI